LAVACRVCPVLNLRQMRDSDRLVGWKEIAAYLKVSERTARRWEASGLPVKRPNPEQRGTVFASPQELDEWVGRGAARELNAPRPKRWVLGLGVLGAVSLVVVLAGWWRASIRPEVWLGQPLVAEASLDYSPALTGDGRRLAFVRRRAEEGVARIWERDLESGEEKELSQGAGTDWGPAWARDGKLVAFTRLADKKWAEIVLLNRETHSERVLARVKRVDQGFPFGATVAWTADGSRLLTLDQEGEDVEVRAFPVNGGQAESMGRLQQRVGRGLSLSPDGKRLAVRVRMDGGKSDVATYFEARVFKIENGKISGEGELVSPPQQSCVSLTWGSNEELILVLLDARTPWVARHWINQPGKWEPVALADRQVSEVAYDAKAKMMVYSRYSWNLDIVGFAIEGRRIGREIGAYGATKDNELALAYHPDGRRFAVASGGRGPMELLVGERGEAARQVGQLGASTLYQVNWLPGGEELLMLATVGGRRGLYKADLIRNVIEPVAEGLPLGGWFRIRRGGNQLLATLANGDLALVEWKTGRVTRMPGKARALDYDATKDVAFLLRGAAEVWRLDLASGRQEKVHEGVTPYAAMAVDGDGLWLQRKAGTEHLETVRLDFSTGRLGEAGMRITSMFPSLFLLPGKELAGVVFREFDSDLMIARTK